MTQAFLTGRPKAAGVKILVRRGLLFSLVLLSACSSFSQPNFDKQDRGAGLSRQDYRDALSPRGPENDGSTPPPPIPQEESLIPMPNLALPANARSVTISVNEDVPIRDVLVELARQANVGLELDPRISGSLIFSVRQRPFEEVIERIADMADLRYDLDGNVLRIERDLPYLQNYRVDYLNVIRDTKSSVSTTVDVVGGEAVGGEGSGGQGNSSASEVSSESKNNFWEELEANVGMLMSRSAERENLLSKTGNETSPDTALNASDAGAAASAIPEPLPVAPIPSQAGDAAPSGLAAALNNITGVGAALAIAAQGEGGAANAAAPAAAAGQAAAAAPATTTASDDPAQRPYSINRIAGLVNIYGTRRQHTMVEAYLRKLRSVIAGQVLIEAKVLEVQLSDGFESGINWAGVLGAATGAARFGNTVAVPQSGPFDGLNAATSGVVTLALDRNDIDAVASLAQQFGTVRTLSSPRLTVQHNQSAVLKVVENRVFFELDFERTTNETNNTDRVTVESNIRTVPEGVIITVQPSIHAETGEIAMTLRPTITRITGTVNDPGVAIASNNTVQSPVPIIAVQEIDSMVTVRSGRVLVMGGLMQDSGSAIDTGMPGVSSLPLIGNLFKSRSDLNRQTELVIFLRATIIEGSGVSPADADLYRTFGRDRRPLPF
ncbi:MAG: type II and III secretion system family protein [Alphaproteobacteria bacterium]